MKNKVMKVAKLPIVLGIIAFLALGSLIVYAATNASDVKSNDLEVGILKGDVKEDFTETSEVNQDTDVKKEVAVENTGNVPLFTRVMLFPEILSSNSKVLPAIIGEQIKLTIGSEWLDGGDGYFYYTGKLISGDTTSNLITTVNIDSSKTTDEYTDAVLTIYTKSETVSTSGNNYRQAWWGNETIAPTSDTLKAVDDKLQALKD